MTRCLALLAGVSALALAAAPATAQNKPVSALVPRGQVVSTDQVPNLPAGATTLQASYASDLQNYALTSLNGFPGVDPTGVADSTAGIQAAINTGQKLYCQGVYKVSATLNLTSLADNGQMIQGSGSDDYNQAGIAGRCVFRAASVLTGPMFLIDGTALGSFIQSVKFRDFVIDMTAVANSSTNSGFKSVATYDDEYVGIRVIGDNMAETVTAATGNGATATLTYTGGIPYVVGGQIEVTGVVPTGYDGIYTVTGIGSGTVSYPNPTTAALTEAGVIAGKRAWLFGASSTLGGTYTSSIIDSQGYVFDFQGYSYSNGVTTINMLDDDGMQIIENYMDRLHVVGGAFQCNNCTHVVAVNTAMTVLQTDIEGTGTYLRVDSSDSGLVSMSELQGFTGTYEIGHAAPMEYLWDQQLNFNTYPANFNYGSLQLNNQGTAGYSTFFSGSATANYYLSVGRTGNDSLWAVAGTAGQILGATSQGDTIIGSNSPGENTWIMAAGVQAAEATPTGFNTFGTGTLNENQINTTNFVLNGYGQLKLLTDGDLVDVENAEGHVWFNLTTSVNAANNTLNLQYGAQMLGYNSSGAETYSLLGQSGAATFLAINAASESVGSKLIISATAPTYLSGFSTGTPTITGATTAAFILTVGATPTTTGALSMPAAVAGWNCIGIDRTTAAGTVRQTASGATSVTFALAAIVSSDVLQFQCLGY